MQVDEHDPVAGTFDDLSDLLPPPDLTSLPAAIAARSRTAAAVWDASKVELCPVRQRHLIVTVPTRLTTRAQAASDLWREILSHHHLTHEIRPAP